MCRPKEKKKKKKRGALSKSQEQEDSKGNQASKAKDKAIPRRLLIYLEFPSYIKGKSMKLGCFSIMFDVSIACHDKL